jgi:FlaA1/EpsC-like NDP-sugar epimerase
MTSNSSVIGMNHSDLFENKNILVLGGTGYLGRAIVTEVLKYNPRSVTILSRDEVKIFYTTQLFKNNSKVHGVIGDIRDYECMLKATRSIDIVFHVAALKRMDMLESNIEEAIKTNVLGTINVFNACIVNDVSKVLFISTDKASLPINAYGACKFISEKIFTNYDTTKIKTKFIATRFGNILESTGSVIPIFTEKINKGEDIPLTDEKMTRFIVSKEEAVELMFNALRYGIGGEIFVRRLPALRVIDLIEVLKTQYNGQNKIKLIGLRPGEKIHEVLINEFEMARTYVFDNYFVITPSFSYWLPSDFLDEEDVPQYIKRGRKVETALMHNYSSSEEVVSRDELAKTFVRLGLFQ